MLYESKKDSNLKAKVIRTDERAATTVLEYISGDNVGKNTILSNSTLKRWWRKIEEETTNVPLNIDLGKVNEPYPEPKQQKYIPKPKSVIEYEAKKHKYYNNDLPSFETIISDVSSKCAKINETSKYVKFKDKSTLWRKQGKIDIYASENLWKLLTETGLISKPNKNDKDRPFAFEIKTIEDYKKVLEVISNV